MSIGTLYYPSYTPGFGSKPRLQTIHPFRSLVAADSNMHNQWSGPSGHTANGYDNPDYEYHSGPSAHVPSGGSYSYHSTTGTGYGPPVAPAAHPPPKTPAHPPTDGAKKGIFGGGGNKRAPSAMSALTLLSFLFFINLLQSCIKDHMDAMNPTVMVMTPNVIRNRFNKMGEMNSREQGSSYTSNEGSIALQPADLIQVAAAQAPAVTHATKPSVNLQSTYSNNPVSYNKPPPPQSPPHYTNNIPEPEVPHYDPYKPDHYDNLSQPHHTLSYDNQSLIAQPPAPRPHQLKPLEQHYTFHHTEYSAQPSPPRQTSYIVPQYTGSAVNPFYEHQHPTTAKPYNSNYDPQYGGSQSDYDFSKKYEMNQHHQHHDFSQPSSSNNDYPWSSNLPSSSVLSGTFRRASISPVAPKTRWISVPAKIIDRSYFDAEGEEIEEPVEHHDDRDMFRSRFAAY